MPNMADITVKKADGTTDIVYVSQKPSGGDNIPALWRADAANTTPAFRQTYDFLTRTGSPDVRRATSNFVMPIVRTYADGIPRVIGVIRIKGDYTLPQNLTEAELKEAIYQEGNLTVATLIRDSLTVGFAPT